MDLRRNIRVNLQAEMTLKGTDRWGRPFTARGMSVDFSRGGLGLVLDEDIVAPGSVITVGIPKRFQSNALVLWVRADSDGKFRLGARLIDPKASVVVRVAASVLLCLAVLGQFSFARSRTFTRTTTTSGCTMSLSQMKDLLQKALSQYAVVSDSDKAFVHVQHQNMTCEEYTRIYEKSDFYADPKHRAALANWHRNVYHAKDSAVRAAAVQSIQSLLGNAAQ